MRVRKVKSWAKNVRDAWGGAAILSNFSALMQLYQWVVCCFLGVVEPQRPHKNKGMFVPLHWGYTVAASALES